MKRFSLFCFVNCALGIVLSGCGPSKPFGMEYVEGVVFVDGKPLAGVNVTFSPTGDVGSAAGGMTDSNGKFRLTTGGAPVGSGAWAGEYNVTFVKESIKETTMEEAERGIGNTVTYLIPQKYGDAKTSGAAPVKIERGKKNSFQFKLNGS